MLLFRIFQIFRFFGLFLLCSHSVGFAKELECVELAALAAANAAAKAKSKAAESGEALKEDQFSQYIKSIAKFELLSKEDEVAAVANLVQLETEMIGQLLESDASLQRFIKELERRLAFGPSRLGELVSILPGNESEEDVSAFHSKVSRVVEELKSLLNKRKSADGELIAGINARISSVFRSVPWRRLVARSFLSERSNEEWAKLPESLVMSYSQTRQRIIESNMRLVIAPAVEAWKRKGARFDGRVDRMDFVMKGNEGLMVAIDTFEPAMGFRISTHIVNYVINKMKDKEGNLDWRLISVPLARRIDASQIQRYINRHYAATGLTPTNEEISEALHIPLERVRDLLSVYSSPASIDQPVGPNNFDRSSISGHSIPDRMTKNKARLDPEVLRLLNVGLEAIPIPRDYKIMRALFGLSGRDSMTLEAVGNENKLSKERIRQIKDKSLQVIKYAIYLDKMAGRLPFEDAQVIKMRWGLFGHKPQPDLRAIAEALGRDLQDITNFLADVETEAQEFFPLE